MDIARIIAQRHAEPDIFRCRECPSHPVLPVPCAIDTSKCRRCQGERRYLPLPHPSDHLCSVCRSECVHCMAPMFTDAVPRDGMCRACRGLCDTCGTDLEPMPLIDPAWPEAGRKVRSAAQKRCKGCTTAYLNFNPFVKVASALPLALLRECGDTTPALVADTIRSELEYHSPEELIARIERRWWTVWSNRRLSREDTEDVRGYGPDDVAYWLVAPPQCANRDCEDGWLADDSGPCPECRQPNSSMNPVTIDWQPANRTDPERASVIAAEIRHELRWRYGVPRSQRGRHVSKKQEFEPYVPAPFTLREPAGVWPPREPDATDSPVLEHRERADHPSLEAAIRRARADKAARKSRRT